MHESDVRFLERLFKSHYFENADRIPEPLQLKQREFGYRRFNGGMVRHLAVRNAGGLRLMLVSNSPSDVYCSSAYYSFPDLDMGDKDWRGADLIFDIDSKDLRTECRQGHTACRCGDCQAVFSGKPPCPSCRSARHDNVSVACDMCIEASKGEVRKLLDILTADFSIRDIAIYFSGNDGFHVHARSPPIEQLGSRERAELVDYVRFRGAIPERFGMSRNSQRGDLRRDLPELDGEGREGRVAMALFGNKAGRERFIAGIKTGSYEDYRRRLEEMSRSVGAAIDPHVTTDIHRIFRMPHSLSGKSGLAKVPCEDLDRFDPYREACVLDDIPAEVTAHCPVSFRLRGHKFGPYTGERIDLPGYAAAYMICKGLATCSPQ